MPMPATMAAQISDTATILRWVIRSAVKMELLSKTLLPRSGPVEAKGPRVRSGLAMDDATTDEQPVVGFVERLAFLLMDKTLQGEGVPVIVNGYRQMQREIAARGVLTSQQPRS